MNSLFWLTLSGDLVFGIRSGKEGGNASLPILDKFYECNVKYLIPPM